MFKRAGWDNRFLRKLTAEIALCDCPDGVTRQHIEFVKSSAKGSYIDGRRYREYAETFRIRLWSRAPSG